MTAAPESRWAVLAHTLGHDFRDPGLLREAMTHPSVNPEDRGEARFGYERLEFLGDRVLGLVVAEWLLERFHDEPEGPLARRYTALVRRESLARAAEHLGLGDHLLLSVGEETSGGRGNAAILADACEAAIGALYLDGGLDTVRRFIRKTWTAAVEHDGRPPLDPKTALQEWAQGRGLPLPRYETVSRAGPDHEPVFEVKVQIAGRPAVVAAGSTKRGAAKLAASRLLDLLEEG